MFKKLYYYYHHYKMWNYIIGQLKAHPQAILTDIKRDYLSKINFDRKHLDNTVCYLCSYNRLMQSVYEKECAHCPLRKKYNKTCFAADSLYCKVSKSIRNRTLPEERIAAAEKIRDCVISWKNKDSDKQEVKFEKN